MEYAEANGYTVPSEWLFRDEGYSGSVLVRPGLERLRDLAAEGSIEAVLVYGPDRLSRKYAYQVLLLEEFARHGVEVIFIQAPQATTPEEKLLVQLQGMIAEYERAQIAERTRRGKRYRAKGGLINVLCGAPYGYRYVKKSQTSAAFYEVIEEEACVVRQVYRFYTEEGWSIGAIVRWLNAQGIPTRKRRSAWERTTVWAMLRNPSYQGTACFGKTERAERQKVTRLLRRQGGFSFRSSANKERPRQEWIAMPVPAIVSPETFALAQQRLQRNKLFASRHTKEPTLLQGILVCQRCGYAYYRTSTRTLARKLYYYRCLGSDDWRYPKGRVCTNRPVRQDYLDDLVWREVIQLLENPDLVCKEMERRIRELQESNPTRVRKEVLHKEITRVQKGLDRLLDAYQEGLLPLEQLRRRMPEVKRREAALRTELQTLQASMVDRERHLRLVGNLEEFLSRLRQSAQTLHVRDRQRILRLVVKEILVGPDTLTIEHSIPASSPSGSPKEPSYVLCGWSHHPTLQRPFLPRHQRTILHLHGGFKPPLNVEEYPPALRVLPYRAHDQRLIKIVKEASDIQVDYPVVAPASLPRHPDSIERRLPRPVPVGVRVKVGFHQRLQVHLDNCLGNPVRNGRYPEQTNPAFRLLYFLAPDRQRSVPSLQYGGLYLRPMLLKVSAEFADGHPVHSRRTFVAARLPRARAGAPA